MMNAMTAAYRQTYSSSHFAWCEGSSHFALKLHSLCELSQ